MMYRFNQSRGFSLIELMVVLAIVAVLLSLTGGLLQRNISQQERIVELEKVNQLFSQLSYKAYYGAGPYAVRFQENSITIRCIVNTKLYSDDGNGERQNDLSYRDVDRLDLNQLTFVAQDYVISSKGVISPPTFSVIDRDNIKQFSFKAIFDEAAN